MADSSFAVTTQRGDDGVMVMAVAGELDVYTADQLRACLSEALDDGDQHIVIDLHDVEFVDLAGFNPIFEARHSAPTASIRLRQPGPSARKLLMLTGMDQDFQIDLP